MQDALLLVQDCGVSHSLHALEQSEPALAALLAEGWSSNHPRQGCRGECAAAVRSMTRQMLTVALTCIEALRQTR